jgi:hypothetical protein
MSQCRSVSMAAATALLAMSAQAGELAATYFTVVEQGDPDFNTRGCCVFTRHLVQSTLGPNALPLLDPAYSQPVRSYYVVHDVNEAGEITWWTPGATVTATGTGISPMPIANDRLFPPNGTGPDNAHGFQTAILRGILNVPRSEPVRFTIGADDAAFLYLDGALVADLGGIHPRINLPVVTEVLQPGDHCLALFYADLYPDHPALFFSIETSDVAITARAAAETPPEPAGCALPVSPIRRAER